MSVLELPIATQIRLPAIKGGLLNKLTREDIGHLCNVTERTIRRDIEAWTQTDDFINWIRLVWLDKYSKVDDVKAFEQATKIMVRSMELKIHARVEESPSVQIETTKEESDILNRAAAILDAKLGKNSRIPKLSQKIH